MLPPEFYVRHYEYSGSVDIGSNIIASRHEKDGQH